MHCNGGDDDDEIDEGAKDGDTENYGDDDGESDDDDDDDGDLVLKVGWGVSGLSECLVRVVKTSG